MRVILSILLMCAAFSAASTPAMAHGPGTTAHAICRPLFVAGEPGGGPAYRACLAANRGPN